MIKEIYGSYDEYYLHKLQLLRQLQEKENEKWKDLFISPEAMKDIANWD